MRIFLSSRYSRRDELRGYRTILEQLGHTIISRWLDTDWETQRDYDTSAAPPGQREEYAKIDLEDVAGCDVLLAFTDPLESRGRRGGRHVELGYAMGLNLVSIIIGPPEHIFHYHPKLCHCPTLEEFTAGLALIARHKHIPKDQIAPWMRYLGGAFLL